MLSPVQLLERERLNHLYFIDEYRDPADKQYLRNNEIGEAHKQIKRLDIAIGILKEQTNDKEATNDT